MLKKKVIVFDFDGTLVQSNELKYNAYFQILRDNEYTREIISKVLETSFEASRFQILEEIANIIYASDRAEQISEKVMWLSQCYNDIVLEGAKKCPEMPGAKKILDILSASYSLYLSSTTPEVELKKIIQYRGWEKYFKNIYGYPHTKTETLRTIIEAERVSCDDILVVGDGDSDRLSAEKYGISFFQVNSKTDLTEVLKII